METSGLEKSWRRAVSLGSGLGLGFGGRFLRKWEEGFAVMEVQLRMGEKGGLWDLSLWKKGVRVGKVEKWIEGERRKARCSAVAGDDSDLMLIVDDEEYGKVNARHTRNTRVFFFFFYKFSDYHFNI